VTRDRQRVRSSPTRLSLRIDDLAPGGHGVGHATVAGERRAVFVPRVALGDVVDVEVDLATRPARGKLLRLVTHGEGRVPSPCSYVDKCGGCDWMHLSADAQRTAREAHLRRALPVPYRDQPIIFHDPVAPLRYRTRARFHIRASGGRAVVGFHAAETRDTIGLTTCVALHPAIDASIALLGALLEAAHGVGEASVALGDHAKPVFDLAWHGTLSPASFARLEAAVNAGACAGGRIRLDDTTRPAVVGDPSPRMVGGDDAPIVLPPGGFAQASEVANIALARRVCELVAEVGGRAARSLVELHSGAGNFTVLLAREFPRVIAVESDAAACEAARRNLAARGLVARVTCADAETFALPPRTDVVVLDPPRSGAKGVSVALAASSVKAIVYVSCDAPTLGRDLGVLAQCYEPVSIESFGMFPGTSHSESLVALRRFRPPARRRPVA